MRVVAATDWGAFWPTGEGRYPLAQWTVIYLLQSRMAGVTFPRVGRN